MKKLRILKQILVRTRALLILSSFFIFFLIAAALIMITEPGITSYSDAAWFCYAVLVIAIVTGVVVNYYTQIIRLQEELTQISNRAKEIHHKINRS